MPRCTACKKESAVSFGFRLNQPTVELKQCFDCREKLRLRKLVYRSTPEGKAAVHRANHSEKGKASVARHIGSDTKKATARRFLASPKGAAFKERRKKTQAHKRATNPGYKLSFEMGQSFSRIIKGKKGGTPLQQRVFWFGRCVPRAHAELWSEAVRVPCRMGDRPQDPKV